MKTTKTRLIFFTIALTYNLILKFHLREFLVLSPTLQVFYLLSALPTLFLAVEIKTKAMKAAVYILLILIACMNIAYISVFRPLRVVTRNKKPPAMRVGNKGYTKNITNQLQ